VRNGNLARPAMRGSPIAPVPGRRTFRGLRSTLWVRIASG
jgi:hypothetical protein